MLSFFAVVVVAFCFGWVVRDIQAENARRAEREWREFVENHEDSESNS